MSENCPWCGSPTHSDSPETYWACGSWNHSKGPWQSDACRIRVLESDNARLQAVVDKLPKTKDGVPVVDGGKYWFLDWENQIREREAVMTLECDQGGHDPVYAEWNEAYSALEAAEEARKTNEEKK